MQGCNVTKPPDKCTWDIFLRVDTDLGVAGAMFATKRVTT